MRGSVCADAKYAFLFICWFGFVINAGIANFHQKIVENANEKIKAYAYGYDCLRRLHTQNSVFIFMKLFSHLHSGFSAI